MDLSDSPDFVLTYTEWVDFMEQDEAFNVASAIPNSSRKGKYLIVLADRVAFFDAADYDMALMLLRGELNLE